MKSTLAALCLLFASACIPLPKYRAIDERAEPYPSEKLAAELDPWLLADGLVDRLVIEIDWVEGCEPGPRTLRGFERIVRKYVPTDRVIEIRPDDEIPLAAWDGSVRHPAAVRALVQEFAGTVARKEDRVEKRYVLFVPAYRGGYGVSTHWTVEREGKRIPISGVVVSRGDHVRSAKLWLSRDRLERGTLIHEFGHELGLVTNDRHERIDSSHVHHCTGLGCLMAHPTPKVLVHNAPKGLFNLFPKDYCRRCREDIRRAQQYWRETMTSDPDYAASIERQRDSRREQLPLWELFNQGRFEDVLVSIASLCSRGAERADLARLEALTLSQLGRETEALDRLMPTLDDRPRSREDWRRRQQAGRLLIGFGRHDEAIDLFDRDVMRAADAYEFEQSTMVLLTALEGSGRFADAGELIDELLERGHAISISPTGMLIQRAGLLRRAGMLTEADELVSRGLRKESSRTSWLAAARLLREAQRRADEAAALLAEQLENTERDLESATNPRARWMLGWTRVRLLAESGERERASALAHELDAAGTPEESHPAWTIHTRASAWIELGEPDRAAELVRSLAVRDRGIVDPCGAAYLEPLRHSPLHAELFSSCPVR